MDKIRQAFSFEAATTGKRNLSEVSEASSSSPSVSLDSKRAKQLSSLNSMDEYENIAIMAETLSENRLLALLADMKNEIVREVNDSFTKHTQALELRILDLENENIQLKQDNVQLIQQIKNVETEYAKICQVAQTAKAHAVENEQYSRKSNIKIIGLNESKQENQKQLVLDLLKEKMDVNLREKDIDVAHRVGIYKKNNKYPRAMIVRFVRRDHKMLVMKNRKKLKGQKYVVVDDLCQELVKVYNRVRNDERVQEAWTWFGKVFIKDKKGGIHRVMYGQSLSEVLQLQEKSRSRVYVENETQDE